MIRALVVFAHPTRDSYSGAVLAEVEAALHRAGAQVEVLDLYQAQFQPVLEVDDWHAYLDPPPTGGPLVAHIAALKGADTLIFVYPTWWYGLPAIMKGWLDRVLLPGVAFDLPPDGPITPGLRHITRLGAFTTCGASWWLTRWIGSPGRRTLLRGIGVLCAPRRRTAFVAHYSMDRSTPQSRARHLTRVRQVMDRLLG